MARPGVVTVVSVADSIAERGDVLTAGYGEAYDPFERLDDRGMDRLRSGREGSVIGRGLLLAEEFARLDATRPRRLRSWLLARGAVNRLEFYGHERPDGEAPLQPPAGWDAQDTATGIQFEQAIVRGELDWLAELTATSVGGKVWNLKNGVSWDQAMIATRARLRWRAELAIRSTSRLVPIEDAGGEEITVELGGLLRAVSWREQREWHSILAPIALQLFEAWRRISEGRPGAAVCRECDQVFLVLDGRRTAFCTDRERMRLNQRARRVGVVSSSDERLRQLP